GGCRAIAGPDMVEIQASVPLTASNERIVSRFPVSAGQTETFVLTWQPSHQAVTHAIDPRQSLADTGAWWREWASRCTYAGPWKEAVLRSLITLKALTYTPTGGIVAAPTTSLPESLGGARNWDYRYCWLRDATFTLYALIMAGYTEEAKQWSAWLLRAVAASRNRCRPSTAWPVNGGSRRSHWMGFPVMQARDRCGWATPRTGNSNSISTGS
ncbi:MAG: glycoside hydrolase family 15 protein, partial [Gammaproteobacteria bacterium]